jgi:hypothetical protein
MEEYPILCHIFSHSIPSSSLSLSPKNKGGKSSTNPFSPPFYLKGMRILFCFLFFVLFFVVLFCLFFCLVLLPLLPPSPHNLFATRGTVISSYTRIKRMGISGMHFYNPHPLALSLSLALSRSRSFSLALAVTRFFAPSLSHFFAPSLSHFFALSLFVFSFSRYLSTTSLV